MQGLVVLEVSTRHQEPSDLEETSENESEGPRLIQRRYHIIDLTSQRSNRHNSHYDLYIERLFPLKGKRHQVGKEKEEKNIVK